MFSSPERFGLRLIEEMVYIGLRSERRMKMMKSLLTDNRQKTQPKSMGKMEAIAYGVQARFEEKTGYFKHITEETANIARSLGVSNTEIEKWIAYRTDLLSRGRERIQEIKHITQKA